MFADTLFSRCGRAGIRRSAHTLLIAVATIGPAGATAWADTCPDDALDAGPDPWRVLDDREVHRFTFTEPENYTPVPKYWVSFQTVPGFVVGRFDPDVGHESSPSFYLGLNGRDVAFRYNGPSTEMPVRPNSDYQITAWIKPDRLDRARAQLTAFYVDGDGLPLAATQVFSPLVGPGEENEDGWQVIRIHLAAAPPGAHSIGLTARVLQERTWRTDPLPHRYIQPVDVNAGAWFDDIVVHRLPKVRVRAAVPGNVFVAPQPAVLETEVFDAEPEGLHATLTLADATGQKVETVPVPVGSTRQGGLRRVDLGPLEPGLYHAFLEVTAADERVTWQSCTFACVERWRRSVGEADGAFGVVIEGPGSAADQAGLITASGGGAVKLPLWGDAMTPPGEGRAPQAFAAYRGFADEIASLDMLLNHMVEARVNVTGVLAGPPTEPNRPAGDFPRALLDVLADDPSGWRDALGQVVTPYASVIQTWQIGRDDDASGTDPERLSAVLPALRAEMKALITAPQVSVTANVHDTPVAGRLPADRISVTVGSDVVPAWIPEHLRPFVETGYDGVEAYLEPQPAERYDRMLRLADLAKRLIYARYAGADRVFIPQPWRERQTLAGVATEPTEELIIQRTIADLLGSSAPAAELAVAPNLTCLGFQSSDQAVLVLWDDAAPVDGRPYVLPFGEARGQIDVWGRETPLDPSDDGRSTVRISSLPTFIDGVDPWLVAFLAHARMEPPSVEFRLGSHAHTLSLTAPSQGPMSGTVTLDVPAEMEVSPSRFTFALGAGESLRQAVNIRYGRNESAGPKTVVATIELSSEPAYRIDVPFHFDVGLRDIEVWAHASLQGDRLLIRHGLMNRTDGLVSFRGFADAPGRVRQHHRYDSVPPGQTRVTEYVFDRSGELAGRMLRVGLREVGGPRAHNLEIVAP